VRDNFPLFVRCAEGFEEFRRSSEDEVGLGLNERIDKLEAIAESCSLQAKKSFKPLLDNTNEVRKVQSAMSVLGRIAPILQVPALMRQHIENRRYSQALKTYRRVLVVDRNSKIQLLDHVRVQAEECVFEARHALESRLAQNNVPVDDLLESIRDIDELLQLTDIPTVSKKGKKPKNSSSDDTESDKERGIYDIGGNIINIREHPPSLACLLLQAAHMAVGVQKIIDDTDGTVQRIFSGESLTDAQNNAAKSGINPEIPSGGGSVSSGDASTAVDSTKSSRASGNQ